MSTEPIEDPVFLQGLAAIVGPLRAQGASEEEVREVTERAWEFYQRSREEQSTGAEEGQPSPASLTDSAAPTDPSLSSAASSYPASSATDPTAPPATTSTPSVPPGEPPYPVSFSELAAMIASGAPIAGIKDIPDRLAEGSPAPSTVDVASVRKPWEVEVRGKREEAGTTAEA